MLRTFSDPAKFYNAYPFPFLFTALLVLIFGPGRFSLNFIVGRLVARKIE